MTDSEQLRERFIELRAELANLYLDEDNVILVAQDVVDVANVTLNGSAVNQWNSIMRAALADAKLGSLIDRALQDYPDNVVLNRVQDSVDWSELSLSDISVSDDGGSRKPWISGLPPFISNNKVIVYVLLFGSLIITLANFINAWETIEAQVCKYGWSQKIGMLTCVVESDDQSDSSETNVEASDEVLSVLSGLPDDSTTPATNPQVAQKKSFFVDSDNKLQFSQSGKSIDLNDRQQLRKLFGQIFLTGIDSTAFTKELKNEWDLKFEDLNIGGVFLERRNLRPSGHREGREHLELGEVIGIINRAKSMRLEGEFIPRFVAVDHEGGNVSQLMKRNYTNALPAPMGLASLGLSDAIRKSSEVAAQELKQLGINMKLGPVVDVNIERENRDIRDRSFGSNHALVIAAAREEIKVNSENGLISVIKHYPVHGHTKAGFETPNPPESNQHDIKMVENSLKPFMALAKISPTIMTSHMKLGVLDIDNVTTNKSIVGELLRREGQLSINGERFTGLNYDGLIMTDNLNEPSFAAVRDEVRKVENENGAFECPSDIKEKYLSTIDRNTKLAFDAGHDIFLFSHVFDLTKDDNPKVHYEIGHNRSDLDWCTRWAMSLEDFRTIYESLRKYIFDQGTAQQKRARINQLRKSIIRVLNAKAEYLLDDTQDDTGSPFTPIVPGSAAGITGAMDDLIESNRLCAQSLIADSVTIRHASGTGGRESHYLKNLDTSNNVIMFSFVGSRLNNSNINTTSLRYRYHRNIVSNLITQVGEDKLTVNILKRQPVEDEDEDLVKQVLDKVRTVGNYDRIIFNVDEFYEGWGVVKKAIKGITQENLIEPRFIHTFITRNPVILSDIETDIRPILQQTNVYVPYNAYEDGAKIQIDRIFRDLDRLVSQFPFETNQFSTAHYLLDNARKYECISP